MLRSISFFEARTIIKKTHGRRVINCAGATKAPIQSPSLYTQTDVSWVGAQPIIRKQRPAASFTSSPVPSVLQSVAPTKSSPPKTDTKSSKPSLLKDSPVHESDAYFTVKMYKGKNKERSLIIHVQISTIKSKESILNKERLKRSYQASDFLYETEISACRFEMKKIN